ncbi:hypothetical protein NIES4072_62540 [Nostoc commune NIES-4072]|uniref:Uncharacterized protein n=1 Tax=Nostoc commune NIES-4072 TaxID=2005467 RepID=A0A2R5G237_NOSCO|nr:hypothetical protein NIES4070_28420 [Nostoc commune HK-02]GBG22543.1 hypothetical protein NIES4072_62540 [Nostoc commune NIES-4072]
MFNGEIIEFLAEIHDTIRRIGKNALATYELQKLYHN